MRRLCVGLVVAVILATGGVVLFALGMIMTDGAQLGNQVCGAGVTLRGSIVMVDGYKAYDYAGPPGAQTMPPATAPVAKDAPTKIVLGESVSDKTLICTERPTGQDCLTVGQLRPAAKAGK